MSRFWFAKNDPSKYRDIYDKINIFEYYQKFVGDYEEVMRGWGYCVPEVTVDAIEKFGGVADRCEMQLHIQRSAKVGALKLYYCCCLSLLSQLACSIHAI